MTQETHRWWTSLKHSGLLIAPSKLAEYFPDEPEPLTDFVAERLRCDVTRLIGTRGEEARLLIDTALERIAGLGVPGRADTGRWLKGNDVPTDYTLRALTGEAIKPQRLWRGLAGEELPVFVFDDKRVGIGRGRRSAARVVEWLRRSDRKLALLTNARQWRLIYAGIDHEAFAEWDCDLWFEQGQPSLQVAALRALLGPAALMAPKRDAPSHLLAAIEASRKGQAELSSVLGERVRQAVELLIQAHGEKLADLQGAIEPRDIYLAATRIVMRLVVSLFAEARDLLPRDNAIYHNSYGLGGLREALDRIGGGAGRERLRHRYGAWPRILAMFRLMYEGSPHEQLPIPRYGGGLFEPGDPSDENGVRRALAVFESVAAAPNDATAHRILELLTRTKIKVGQGRSSRLVEAPVDFSDLSTEYIGILYEGLLDFELRRVTADETVVFLALGDEPALPLSRLEAMDDKAIEALIEGFKKKSKKTLASEEGGEEEEEDESDDNISAEEVETPENEEDIDPVDERSEEEDDDRLSVARRRAEAWSARAIRVSGLIKLPRSKKADARREYDAQIADAAARLAKKIVLPGEWYLVRFGGTRKGSGTFYTRPALAVPTVRRTLQPLAYEPQSSAAGADEDAPLREWTPKRPEEILQLKLCDPGCGSGSFLVASLRFLTQALSASLYHHGRIQEQGEATLVTLAEGRPSRGQLSDETLPCRPDAEDFDERLAARLKRYIVERCLYGVDLDPLAVELCRLALWVETLDRSLPFSFLDHKIKCGNSLVGCWFDQFDHYPILAFDREGGDKEHARGHHYDKGGRTLAIKHFRQSILRRELDELLRGQKRLFESSESVPSRAIHDRVMLVLDQMHELPVHEVEKRAELYQLQIKRNADLGRLRIRFDTWCALWFWPTEHLAVAPTPSTFPRLTSEALTLVRNLTQEYRFFHWELEFPDVFCPPRNGFSAVLTNPPWDIQKPNSREFFSNLDPLYRTYGKQEGLRHQAALFQSSEALEGSWLDYCYRFKCLANFVKHSSAPYGSPDEGKHFSLGAGSAQLHQNWSQARRRNTSYRSCSAPFRHQGAADLNSYKLYLEMAYSILELHGSCGILVPAGIYNDRGSAELRRLLLSETSWELLFGLINWKKIFESVYYRFKFCLVLFRRGASTKTIEVAFLRKDPEEITSPDGPTFTLPATTVTSWSPKHLTFLELSSARDRELLDIIYSNRLVLGGDEELGWMVTYGTDLHMTTDSNRFRPRETWEKNGYAPDEYGRWLLGKWKERSSVTPPPPGHAFSQDRTHTIALETVTHAALPVYEGRMIGHFDFSKKGWISGKGRAAVWTEQSHGMKILRPQYLIEGSVYLTNLYRERRVGFMNTSSATNARTMVAASIPPYPCGNSVPYLRMQRANVDESGLVAMLNSLPYDFVLRMRCGGLSLNWFVIEHTPVLSRAECADLESLSRSLNWTHPCFAPRWAELAENGTIAPQDWARYWAVSEVERTAIRCTINAVVAALLGLREADFRWIINDCDHPRTAFGSSSFYRSLDPKGFWRVDKSRDPELREPVLSLVAFLDLLSHIEHANGSVTLGIRNFLDSRAGLGWSLPEELRLSDYGLGKDARAKTKQPVNAALALNLDGGMEPRESFTEWEDCERHCHNLLGPDWRSIIQTWSTEAADDPPTAGDRPSVSDQPRLF